MIETTTVTAPPGTIVLGAYAARSCPVKTQNAFNPTLVVATATDDSSVDSSDGLAELFDGGAQFHKVVLDRLLDSCVGEVVDLRPVDLRARRSWTRRSWKTVGQDARGTDRCLRAGHDLRCASDHRRLPAC